MKFSYLFKRFALAAIPLAVAVVLSHVLGASACDAYYVEVYDYGTGGDAGMCSTPR